MEEFKLRRNKLAQQLENNSIALLNGATQLHRNSDVEYFFRQSSDFYYLTGFAEPEAMMVLSKDAKGKVTYILFNRANDPAAEIWNGKRAGQEGACAEYGADESYDIKDVANKIPGLFANKTTIYYPIEATQIFADQVREWLQAARRSLHIKSRSEPQTVICVPDSIIDLLPLIHTARVFKSHLEIEYMRKAAQISAEAHLKLMQSCKPGMLEYQLEAIFNYHCLYEGCRGLAYNSIVAGGSNSCTLHYVSNDQVLNSGDLVLVDAGGEYNYYAADITRTFPVNGKFSAPQRQIYELVLQAQLAGIDQVKPGNAWNSVQDTMVKIIVTGLVELGILKGDIAALIANQDYKQFYMHSSGHWLGLDVHDAGNYKIDGKWREFEPGMVLTVEPGIYISKTTKDIDKKWLGIGVRIEDDILVTNKGNEVLSIKAPKQIAEIESAAL